MINKLHLAMIDLYSGDSKRIQHFCKVHSYAKQYGNCSGKLQEKEGPKLAENLLAKLGFNIETSQRVQYLIAHHHTYDNINSIDWQILVEADFLVNMFEESLPKSAVQNAYNKIFKTASGKEICKKMFLI